MRHLVLLLAALLTGAALAAPAPLPGPVAVDPDYVPPPAPPPGVPIGPKARHAPPAPYDEAERAAGHRGTVLLTVEIGADGQVTSATIRSGTGWPVLDAQALATVRTWTFEPTLDAHGKAKTARTLVAVPFDGKADRDEALVRAAELDCGAYLERVARSAYPDAKAAARQQPEFDAMHGAALSRATRPRQPGEFMAVLEGRERLYFDLVARCTATPRRPLYSAFDDAMVALLGY